jgi:hypothetical protein
VARDPKKHPTNEIHFVFFQLPPREAAEVASIVVRTKQNTVVNYLFKSSMTFVRCSTFVEHERHGRIYAGSMTSRLVALQSVPTTHKNL